uniref:Protein shuttle craft n=1 Tax=Bactrocera latifrons TaxID=174628 RepID=A0A0K8V596_BACLA
MSANPQPPISQIWQGGFGSGLSALMTNGTEQQHQTQQSTQQNSNNFHNSTMNRNNNNIAQVSEASEGTNNYVNFTQFIMQHNFLGNNNGFGLSGDGGSGESVNQANGNENGAVGGATNTVATQVNGGGGVHGQIGATNDYFNFVDAMNHKASNDSGGDKQIPEHMPQQANLYSNSLFSPFNNFSSLYSSSGQNASGGYNTYNDTNTSVGYFDNVYTPFGNSGGYYMNPFATGFDFSASNLQASAPEFVPRFNNLSLNEENREHNKQNDYETASNVTRVDQNKFQTGEQKVQGITNNDNNLLNGVNNGAISTVPGDRSGVDNNVSLTATKNNTATNGVNVDTAAAITSKAAQRQDNVSTKSDIGQGIYGTKSQNNGGHVTVHPNMFNPNVTGTISSSGGGAVSRYTGTTNKQQSSGGSISRGSSSNGFSRNRNDYSGSPHNHERNGNGSGGIGGNKHNNDIIDKSEKPSARAERERERDRDARRYQNGRRSVDYHRSNKRRDDWNRNRDRINGFRVEEKYSTDNGKDSPLPSPEKKSSPKKVYPENEKLSQREKLIRDIETRRLECLVCVEPIKAHHGVWSCNNCYHILHLQCIIKWASSSKSEDGWRCPACQNVVKDVPRDYYCFCGKVKNPPYTRHDIAHTCGDTCGRIEGCTHACTLLCHPGPCPPCQATVKRECGCGKTTKTMQCCLKEPIECESICGKQLNCEVHKCPAKCHDGKCAPCAEKVDQQCHCTKQERQVACTRDSHDKHNYSCGKQCGKDLVCGNHKCKDCCHPGECRTCKLSPEVVTSCPCGKMPIVTGQRMSCLDAIPVCEGVCGKTLRCGKPAHPHHCTSKCHLGNCPPCNKQTAVKCRCGHMDQLIKCRQLSTRADDARCKKRCVKKRSCGKHKCNQECCIDIDHICPMPCNYTLSCGKHKCDQPCHRGNCPPCYRSSFEELYCECGAEVIYPPVPCGTKKPACKRPCSRTHPCQHPPQHNCHSAANCPPCMMFTTKWCFGQHEQRKTIPCSQESFSCGLACGKALPCGRHKCIKTCHEGACQAAGEVCKQHCTKSRTTCGHKCMSPCHDGDCPDTPCKEMVEVQCECGNRKQMRLCHDLAREFSRIATAQLASSMAEMQRGNYMELSEILAPVKINKTNKTLDCNEECRLLERNRRLAIGLQIRNPDVPQKLQTKYSDFIRNCAKRDPTLVKSIHDALTTLVKLAKESKQKSRSHSFPTMNREKRQLVHEMCEMFGVESVAYDAEPNRNVVATAYKDRSWLPATSIMEVMQRESGQRRVPVPSNNAWGIKR